MAKAGAPPKFREAHVNWVFWKIATNEPMGRKMIVQETGLGEGSIRTILDKLDEYGLVKSARSGRALSDEGKKVFQRMRQIIRIEKVGSLNLTGKRNNCLVLVRNSAKKVGSGMDQRDAAIVIGRSGASTMIVKKGELIMPSFNEGMNIDKEYSKDSQKIKKILDPEEGDSIVVGSEDSSQAAEEAAWVAASTLL